MTPQLKVVHNVGNTLTIQNDIQTVATSFLSTDLVPGVNTTFTVENVQDFSAYTKTGTFTQLSQGSDQTWNITDTSLVRVGDFVQTFGATTNVIAIVTGIAFNTSITVSVQTAFGGAGTATSFSKIVPVLVGSVGTENAEVVYVTAKNSTSPNSTLTLLSGSQFNLTHNKGEKVQELAYDKILVRKINSAGTTVETLISPNWTTNTTVYQDATGGTTDSYYIRFVYSYSIGGKEEYYLWSNPSATVFPDTLTPDKAGFLTQQVRDAIGIQDTDPIITDLFLLQALNEARRIVDTDFTFGQQQEWRQDFEHPIQMLAGRNYVLLPDDIDFNETNRSLLNLKYSRGSNVAKFPIQYIDKRSWNAAAYQQTQSPTVSEVLSGATTLQLESTADFPSAGSVTIATNSPTESIIYASYTGNDKARNILTGVTGLNRTIGNPTISIASPAVFTLANHGLLAGESITLTTTGALPTGLTAGTKYYVISTGLTTDTFRVSTTLNGTAVNTSGTQSGTHTVLKTIPANTQAWAYPINAMPLYYTVWNGAIYFDRPIPPAMQGRNCYIDYYKKMVDIESLDETIPEHFRDIYKHFLRFAIKRRRDDGIGEEDPDYKRFIHAASSVFGNKYGGQNVRITT